MDWADKQARMVVDRFLPLFRDGAEDKATRLAYDIAAELRAAALTAHWNAVGLVEDALAQMKGKSGDYAFHPDDRAG